MKLRRRGII